MSILGYNMKKITIFSILMLLSIIVHADTNLPKKELTPGEINASITQDNIQSTICVPHYTDTIRPSSSYTNRLKKVQIVMYGYASDVDMKDVEEDHLIPLSVGGHPTSSLNLWPQLWNGEYGAHKKDRLEQKVHKEVCSGKISLEEGQRKFSGNWIESYKQYYEH